MTPWDFRRVSIAEYDMVVPYALTGLRNKQRQGEEQAGGQNHTGA
jgi:hypothetical protein